MIKQYILVILMTFASPIVFAQDWAQLEHFKQENEALPAPEAGENRVVFMGNSITIGWKDADPEYFEENPYVNRGIGGQTTPQMLLRFRQDVIDLKPRVVVILAGTNDIAENTGPMTTKQILDNIISMAQLAQAHDIHVVLCSVLPAFDYPWRPGLRPNIRIPELNTEIQKYSQANALTYVDYFGAMTDGENGLQPDLGSDGVHPNRAGYDVMKPLLEAALGKVLAKQE